MDKKFLVAVDGSDHGRKALDLATDLAMASDAQLIIVHVVPREPMPDGFQQVADAEGISVEETGARYRYGMSLGDAITNEAASRARERGLSKIETRVAEGSPAHEIVTMAEQAEVDMLFIGSRGVSDLKGLFLGSVSHKVMHLAPCTCVSVK